MPSRSTPPPPTSRVADFARSSTTPAPEWLQYEETWKRPQFPPNATLLERRDLLNARAASVFADVLGRPTKGLNVSDHTLPTTDNANFSTRLYKPNSSPFAKDDKSLPVYISFHGGGYHLNNLETEDPFSRQIALTTGAAVLSVNYRHTPEWTWPAPLDDAWLAFEWVTENAKALGLDRNAIFAGGVSAGANLALTVALRSAKQSDDKLLPRIRGLILATPSVVHPDQFPIDRLQGRTSSLETNANAPFLNAAAIRGMIGLLKADPSDLNVSTLLRPIKDFNGLGPVSIHVAGLDPLCDEGLLLEERLRDAGVSTSLRLYDGLPHSFMSHPALPSAQAWREAMQEQLRAWIE